MKRFISLMLVAVMLALTLTACPAPAPDNGTSGTTTGGNPNNNQPSNISFSGDFTVVGEDAALLTAALEKAGVPVGASDAAKKIIVGESADALLATAKGLASAREGNYGDYALVSDGTNLALYGASDYAAAAAVDYLIATYAKDGAITVSKTLSYAHTPELLTSTVGGAALKDFTVVYDRSNLKSVAENFAAKLSALCGYEIPTSESRSRTGITLRVSDGEAAETYTATCSANQLVIEATDAVTLAAGAYHFLTVLPTSGNMNAGDTMTHTPTYKTVLASNTELIKYCGMWQATVAADADTMVSYWNAAYAEIDFTGAGITVEFSQPTTYKVKMDGGEYSQSMTTDGKVTFYAEGDGTHTIRIYSNDRNKHMYLRSFTVPEGETLSRTPDKQHYIQFVGDSISDAGNSFSHRVGDVLGWDFSVTALSGIALGRGQGYWKINNGCDWSGNVTPGSMADLIMKNSDYDNVAMEDAFFKLGFPDNGMTGDVRELYATKYYTEELDFNFATGNTPDIVFIFLGTNDGVNAEKDIQRFVDAYDRFVSKILETYGTDTQIWIMQALTSSSNPNNPEHARFKSIRVAANYLMELFPENVNFIDWDQVGTWNVEISSDNTHPTGKGYDTLTEKIAAILEEYYK